MKICSNFIYSVVWFPRKLSFSSFFFFLFGVLSFFFICLNKLKEHEFVVVLNEVLQAVAPKLTI